MRAVTTARQRPSFGSGGDFILDTRREVEAYLETGHVRARARQKLYAKTFVAFALWAASWGTLIFAHPGVLLGVPALAGLIFATVLIGFCVQHDANHGAYFGTRRANHLMGWTSDTFAGFSSYAWRVKHNIAHHTYTNVGGLRRRHQPGAVRAADAEPDAQALVPAAAHLHLAAVQPDGAALADGRRHRCAGARPDRLEPDQAAAALGARGADQREADLHRLGDRRAAARLPVVGRPRRLPRLHR